MQGEFPLPGRIRGWCPVEITRKKNGVNLLLNGGIEDDLEATLEIEQARMQARGRVEPPVVLDSEMEIGEMEQLHRGLGFSGMGNRQKTGWRGVTSRGDLAWGSPWRLLARRPVEDCGQCMEGLKPAKGESARSEQLARGGGDPYTCASSLISYELAEVGASATLPLFVFRIGLYSGSVCIQSQE